MRESTLDAIRANWDRLIDQGQAVEFKKGQILIYEGHAPYGVFVILSGSVDLVSENGHCSDEHLWKSPHGGVVGLSSFLTDSPSCCTSIAKEDCRAIFIPKSLLIPLLDKGESVVIRH